jgi:hypothetical protein
LLLLVGFPLQRSNVPKSEDAPNNLYEPVPEHDTIEGSLSETLEIPSITDWLDKNPAIKWGAIASVAALAFLATQGLRNGE